jgi:hypothetical protein
LDQSAVKLTEIDKKIIKSRLIGDPIGEWDVKELEVSYSNLLIKISCISGISLPKGEIMANYLIGQLDSFLIEFNYGGLTEDEILLAFKFNCGNYLRNSGGDYLDLIPLFGECISVDYISKVLYNYSQIRWQLERKLENFIDGY